MEEIQLTIVEPYNSFMVSGNLDGMYGAETRYEEHSDLHTSMELLISRQLIEIGVPASLKGYRYMITAIEQVIMDEAVLEGVTKVLYPEVAKKHNSTSQRVEKAIRHAIEVAWSRNDDSRLKKVFKYSTNSGKGRPTNSEFIALLAQSVKSTLR